MLKIDQGGDLGKYIIINMVIIIVIVFIKCYKVYQA